MKHQKYILLILVLFGLNAFAQSDQSPFKIWRLTALSGQANIRGNYRESRIANGSFENMHSESYINGILQLRSQSYFVHPNFMLVSLNGIYNPETRRSTYIGIPDYSEKSNNEGWDLSTTFLRKKNFNVSLNASNYQSIQNIENLTRIRATNKYKGAIVSYQNNVLPVSFAYTHQKSDQKMLDIVRSFSMNQEIYQGNAHKAFGLRDYHSFTVLKTKTKTVQDDVVFNAPMQTITTVDFLELSDEISFDRNKRYTFTSALANTNEYGTINFKSFSAQENLTLRLPYRFVLSNGYNYRIAKQDLVDIKYQRIESGLSHQLFESLNTGVRYEHSKSDQSNYIETRDKAGLDLKYNKKIPNGKILMSYNYSKEYQTIQTPGKSTEVRREEYILQDNEIILLRNQNIDIQSIVVRDVLGNTIYQPLLDYILIDRSPYIEIIRVPGGLIPNNATVYIDYRMQNPVGHFEMNSNAWITDLWMYNNVLNVYYRLYTQGYSNQSSVENQVLNTITRHVSGVRLDFYFLKLGVEYEYCRSNVLPYEGMKYFVTYQKMYKKIYLTLNGNLSDYKMNYEVTPRRDMDASCKVAYSVNENIRINLDYMYRAMTGRGIDMKVHTSKAEITTILHSLYFTLGADIYWNKSVNSRINYRGVYVQLTRNF